MLFMTSLRLASGPHPPGTLTQELVALEIEHIKKLLASGVIREAWMRNDLVGIFAVFEAAGQAECRQAIAMLPFACAGVLEVDMLVSMDRYLDVYCC